MKRIVGLLMGLFLSFMFLSGCTNRQTFRAEVLENKGTYLLVEAYSGFLDEGEYMVSLRDVTFFDSKGTEIGPEDIEAGMNVEITFNGEVGESYPGDIRTCYKIKNIE